MMNFHATCTCAAFGWDAVAGALFAGSGAAMAEVKASVFDKHRSETEYLQDFRAHVATYSRSTERRGSGGELCCVATRLRV